MSQEVTPPGREGSGHIMKTAAEKVNALSMTGEDGIHPMSRILFGWVSAKQTGTLIFWGMAALSVLLVVLDLFVVRNEKIAIANAVGFYGLWGFAAFSFAVLTGWPLGRLLRRREDYYGEPGGPPSDIDPEIAARQARQDSGTYGGDT